MTSFSQGVDSARTKFITLIKQNNFIEVQQLIEDGVDVNFEDEDGNTPLETAMKLRQIGEDLDKIIELLGKKIVRDSLQMLEEKSKKSKFSPSPKKNEEIRDKIKKKVEFSLKALKDLTHEENDIKKCTYKNVNIFVLFLEAFALQDVEIDKNLTSDEKDELINRYFGQEDNKIIKKVREKFMRRSSDNKVKKVISPLYLHCFICKTNNWVNIKLFFNNLKDYVQAVYNKLNGDKQSQSKVRAIQNILEEGPRKLKSKRGKELLDVFGDFVKEAYSEGFDNLEKQEEILFNLTLNIIPLIDGDLKEGFEELRNLRHKLIHNFHMFRDSNARLKEFKRAIFDLRSKLFKYYCAQAIQTILHQAQLDEDVDRIIDDIIKKLKSLEGEFDYLHSSYMETTDSFEHIPLELLFPEKADVEDTVKNYLTFFAVIDDEKKGQIDDEEWEISNNYTELSGVERREIYEDFVSLQKLEFNDLQIKKEELKVKFGKYGIKECYFNKTMDFSLNDINSIDRENVISYIKGLISLKTLKELEEYKILNQDIISLYDCFIQVGFREETFSLNNHKDLLKSYDLSESAKQFIEEQLSNLIKKDEFIVIPSKNIQINIAKVVNNILKTFYNPHYKYQIKFDNVETAFSDKIILDFLSNNDLKKIDGQKGLKFKNNYYIFWIIKKLLKKEFTAPYIATLITKTQSVEVIEENDLRRLIEILCKKNTYITYLSELLYVKSEKSDFSLYDVVYEIFKKEDINAESMRVLFARPQHAREMIDVLDTRIDAIENYVPDETIKFTHKILKILNDVILELIHKGKIESVHVIIADEVKKKCSSSLPQLYKKLERKSLINITDDLFVDFKLNIVKAKNAEGQEKERQKQSDEARKLYKEALKILEEILVYSGLSDKSPKFLLALSRKAYTYTLLEKYDDSLKECYKLYKLVTDIALGSNGNETFNTKDIFKQLEKSKNYENLLSASNECKKYLNIISIKKSISYSEFKKGIKSEDAEKKKHLKNSLKICKEILSVEQINQTKEYITILPIRRRMILIYKNMGLLRLKRNEYSKALWYNYCALQEATKVFKKESDIFGNGIGNSKRYFLHRLNNIAFTYNKLGDVASSYEEARYHHEKALYIYEQVSVIQNDCLVEGDKDISKNYEDIEYTRKKLTYLLNHYYNQRFDEDDNTTFLG